MGAGTGELPGAVAGFVDSERGGDGSADFAVAVALEVEGVVGVADVALDGEFSGRGEEGERAVAGDGAAEGVVAADVFDGGSGGAGAEGEVFRDERVVPWIWSFAPVLTVVPAAVVPSAVL